MAKKKRYAQSKKDRRDESRGMKNRLSEYQEMGGGLKVGEDYERKMERRDYGTISEDRNAMANLPHGFKTTTYKSVAYQTDPRLDDTMRGVDDLMDDDRAAMMRGIFPKKY